MQGGGGASLRSWYHASIDVKNSQKVKFSCDGTFNTCEANQTAHTDSFPHMSIRTGVHSLLSTLLDTFKLLVHLVDVQIFIARFPCDWKRKLKLKWGDHANSKQKGYSAAPAMKFRTFLL